MIATSFLKLLPLPFKRRAIGMICIGILNKLMELVGLASLLPIIIVIMNPSSIVVNNSFMARLFQFIGLDSLAQFGIILGVVALVLLPVKSILAIWLGNIQNKYYLEIYTYYSRKLYDYYHNKGLLFIKQTYSSQLAFHINGACYGFATVIIRTILNSVSDIVMMVLLAGFLMWLAPFTSLALLAAMVPISLIYFAIVRNKIKEIGTQAYEARRKQSQIVQESLKGHVSLKINNSFAHISEEFKNGLNTIANADIKNTVYRQIPPLIFQICIIIALIILLLEATTNSTSVNSFIVFGFIAIRLMPSVLGLINSWHTLQNNQYVFNVIKEAQGGNEDDKAELAQPIQLAQEIELRNITFAFEADSPLFANYSLKIRQGECIGFRGYSGVGKSSLFNLLLGFYVPQEGGVYIDGIKLSSHNRESWHQLVGYVEQDVFIKNDSLAKNIAMSATEPDKDKILKIIDQVGLKSWFRNLKDGLNTIIGEAGATVSGGEKQRIGIARALYKNPKVLFVDEATSALDAKREEDIISLLHSLASNNFTLLIISHRQCALQYCNRIIDLK
ncbi:ABC transporter ATP-binding protein [Bacteroides sp. 519]|uniref:ATP-binding cassette domain-containing protein n=1 Tax=Bacteroides sp. 519 TaxID=2302937 RepID=UPI0013D7245B|nr:ABC transporter ATP-binding protein [Bacteroides sp. 519]NDV60224.1 ABC transporter ATP-binding protein [Bacteroides sp. 519]